MSNPKLTIVAVTYNHPRPILERFITSLESQTAPKEEWECNIYHDGECSTSYWPRRNHGYQTTDDVLGYRQQWDNFSFIETQKRLGNYGHPNRLRGLNECNTEYIHFTNADNIYNPIFVEDSLSYLDKHPECDVLLMNIIHSYGRGRRYCLFQPAPVLDNVDFMSFIIRTDLMKKIGFKRIDFTGQDGIILEEAALKGANIQWLGDTVIGTHC